MTFTANNIAVPFGEVGVQIDYSLSNTANQIAGNLGEFTPQLDDAATSADDIVCFYGANF